MQRVASDVRKRECSNECNNMCIICGRAIKSDSEVLGKEVGNRFPTTFLSFSMYLIIVGVEISSYFR